MGKDESSDSDEESKTRHSRFTSERFQGSNTSNYDSQRLREEKNERYSSNKYRSRSPKRKYYNRSESSYKKESRSTDGKSTSHSNYSRFHYHKREVKTQKCNHERKQEKCEESEKGEFNKKSSKKLSSLLLDFDKQVEAKRKTSESKSEIGPALPPHLVQKAEFKQESSFRETNDLSIGPALQPHVLENQFTCDESSKEIETTSDNFEVKHTESLDEDEKSAENKEIDLPSDIGPDLPACLQNQLFQDELKEDKVPDASSSSSVGLGEERAEIYGPMLPPKPESDSYGPALPPNFKETVQGPTLPPGMTTEDLERMEQESEDEDTFGPLPEGKKNLIQYQLDLRAMDIKRKLEDGKSGPSKDITKREEWMLELPPEKATNLGLGPRSFRMREGPDMSNRSAWTDTPADKKRKEEMALRGEPEAVNPGEVMRTAFVQERNETMDKISQLSRDENRQESLLEIHQKKMKKKKKKEEKEGKKKERRPFDRNIDLQVNRFDEAQKKAIFKKAQLLDTRFSSGESKYL